MFVWESLRVIGPDVLPYRTPLPGTRCEVQLEAGTAVLVWRCDVKVHYFCHGLTFGTRDAPGGPVSPYSGHPVEAILGAYFDGLPDESDCRAGDVAVWTGVPHSPEGTTPHSAVLLRPVVREGRRYLDASATLLSTKNGIHPEREMSLDDLFALYGETFRIYRRRTPQGGSAR